MHHDRFDLTIGKHPNRSADWVRRTCRSWQPRIKEVAYCGGLAFFDLLFWGARWPSAFTRVFHRAERTEAALGSFAAQSHPVDKVHWFRKTGSISLVGTGRDIPLKPLGWSLPRVGLFSSSR